MLQRPKNRQKFNNTQTDKFKEQVRAYWLGNRETYPIW